MNEKVCSSSFRKRSRLAKLRDKPLFNKLVSLLIRYKPYLLKKIFRNLQDN